MNNSASQRPESRCQPYLYLIHLISPNDQLHPCISLAQIGHPIRYLWVFPTQQPASALCMTESKIKSITPFLLQRGQIDTHRQRLHMHEVILKLNPIGESLETEDPMHRLPEMTHVIVSLESDEIGAEHAAEKVLSGCEASELREW